MKKFVVNVPNAVSAEKSDAIAARIAEFLGIDSCNVLVLGGGSLTAVDCPDAVPAPPPAPPVSTGYGE